MGLRSIVQGVIAAVACFGCADSPHGIIVAAGQCNPDSLAVTPAQLYWATLCDGAGHSVGAVRAASLSDWSTTELVSDETAWALATDEQFLYWERIPNAQPGSIVKISLSGGAPLAVASGQPDPVGAPRSLVVDDTTVYWTNHGDRTVMRLPKTGPTGPATVATGTCVPDIAVDDEYLYWTDCTVLKRQSKQGGAAEVIFDAGTDALWVGAPAVAASSVFFWVGYPGDEVDSTLFRLDKASEASAAVIEHKSHVDLARAVVDDTYVYIAIGGEIERTGLDAESFQSVVSLMNPIRDMIISSSVVYWTDAAGSVYRFSE